MSCPKHPEVMQIMICPACLGEKKSERKAAAARENGKLGGRPRKEKEN